MTVYQNSEQLTACFRDLFDRIATHHADAVADLSRARLIFRFQCQAPAAEVWINGRKQPPETLFGPAALRPDLDIALEGDILHRILLGELSITKALGARQLQVRGPVWKARALADIFRRSQTVYPRVLADHGVAPQSRDAARF